MGNNLDTNLAAVMTQLKRHANIAVIYAGDPDQPENVRFRSHNPRSWKSYRAVAEDIRDALVRLGFESVQLLQEDRRLAETLVARQIDFAWLNTVGVQGMDSSCHCAALLESLGIACVGHAPNNMTLMDNKHLLKNALQKMDVATAPYITWHPRDCQSVKQTPMFEPFVAHCNANWTPTPCKSRFVAKPVCFQLV